MVNRLRMLIDRMSGKAPKGAKRSPKWRKVRAAISRVIMFVLFVEPRISLRCIIF